MAIDNYDNLAGRYQLVHFFKTGAMADFAVHGNGIEDLAMTYDAETQEYKWITSKNGSTTIMGYSISLDQEQRVQHDNPIFKEINKLRKSLDTNAKGTLLSVELFTEDIDKVTTAPAEQMEVGIQFSSYGGSSGDPLTIGYTFTSIGTPEVGIATFTREEDKLKVSFQKENEEI